MVNAQSSQLTNHVHDAKSSSEKNAQENAIKADKNVPLDHFSWSRVWSLLSSDKSWLLIAVTVSANCTTVYALY